MKKVQERKQKAAKVEGTKRKAEGKKHNAKKQAKYDAEKTERSLQEKSRMTKMAWEEKQKQLKQHQTAASRNPTDADKIGQLRFKLQNMKNRLARSEDKAKLAWNRKSQEDSMLQKMEVESKDR